MGSEGDQILWGSVAVSTPVGVGLGGYGPLCLALDHLLGICVAPRCCGFRDLGPICFEGQEPLGQGPAVCCLSGALLLSGKVLILAPSQNLLWGGCLAVLPFSVFPRRFLLRQGSAFLALHPLSNFLTHAHTHMQNKNL